jgi:hypothetical protein
MLIAQDFIYASGKRDGTLEFTITPRIYFEECGYVDDRSGQAYAVLSGDDWDEVTEGQYVYEGSDHPVRVLQQLGITHDNKLQSFMQCYFD